MSLVRPDFPLLPFPLKSYKERYFEMSHVDAKQALELYRHFCKQADLIEEYLGVAKKLQNLLNVSIPTLKSVRIYLGIFVSYLNLDTGTQFSGWGFARIS